MFDQRVESLVFGDNVEESGWVFLNDPANVKGDMEIEGIRTRTGDLYVLGSRPELLEGRSDLERDLALVRPAKHEDREVLMVDCLDRCRLDAFEVDEHDVFSHVLEASSFCRFISFPQKPAVRWFLDREPAASAASDEGVVRLERFVA